MSHHGPSRTARLLPRRRRKVIAAALVALAAIVTGGILWAWLAAEARPAGVVVMLPGDPEAERIGRAIEDGSSTLLSQARPNDPAARHATWSMALKERDATAWLCTRLEPWLLSRTTMTRLPPQLGAMAVRFEDDRIGMLLELRRGTADDSPRGEGRWFTLWFHARVVDRQLYLTVTGVSIGRLHVPVTSQSLAMALDPNHEASGPEERIVRAAIGSRGIKALAAADAVLSERNLSVSQLVLGAVPIGPAELRLPDGRQVLVDDVASADGVLTLRCRTVQAGR